MPQFNVKPGFDQEMGSFDQIDMILRAQIKNALLVSKKFVEDDFNQLVRHLETRITRQSL